MGKTFFVQSLAVALVAAFAFSSALAQRPVDFLRNIGKNVEADPNKEYKLTEMEGPYLIFAAAFSGQTARQDAHAVVLELRKIKKWNAFVYEKNFVFDASKDLKQARNPYTGTTAKYRDSGGGTEFAIVIGNFSSLEDKQLEKTLAEVKKFQPESLKTRGSATPFAFAFALANPMLPPEYKRGEVDTFIASLNKDLQYSLLRNPCRYTVQIATFSGRTAFENSASASANAPQMAGLEQGARAAAKLCKALRAKGVDAYEFHDRYSSIVTVGGFEQHSHRMPNGTFVMDPQVLQIIQQYEAKMVGNKPRVVIINDVECDPRPVVIEVPRPRR